MADVYGIAAFRSRQQVMRYESILRRAGIPVKVITTPRDVAVGCGLSVQFDASRAADVQAAIGPSRPANMIGLYLVDKTGGGRPRLTVLSR